MVIELKVGDIVGLNSLQSVVRDPEITMTLGFKPGRGERFVCLFLGTERKDSTKLLDGNAVMRALGWRLDLSGEEEAALKLILDLANRGVADGLTGDEPKANAAIKLISESFAVPVEPL